MNVVFTGNGTKGSWFCRGEQIGHALGAIVKPKAKLADFRAADLTVVVKRIPEDRLQALRAARRPWVFDVVDFYPQPISSTWSRDEAVQWVRAKLQYLKPSAVIWPTRRMQQDVGFDGPQAVIHHHHRPGIRVNPIRKDVRVVGYEGTPRYIESWRAQIESECDKRGWQFVLNPEHLADVDIVLALRGGEYDGYAPKHWKSNVKLANAHGSGTPFIGSPESGYGETATGSECWATNLGSLRDAFDQLTDLRTREGISDRFMANARPLHVAAQEYREFLGGL